MSAQAATSSSVQLVKSSGSPATSRARAAYLEETNQIVHLSLTKFSGAFFRGGLSPKKCTQYAPASIRATAQATIPQQLEKFVYSPLCGLLNDISRRYCDGEGIADEDRITFVDHSSHPPHRHPHAYIDASATQKPDVVALKAFLALIWGKDVSAWSSTVKRRGVTKPAIAWHHIISAIEAKGTADNRPLPQAATFAGSVMQARPDLGGCFGLAVSAQFFQVLWSDSSAVYASPEIRWDSANVSRFLAQYVHFLHCPPIVDPTITLMPPETGHDDDSASDWGLKCYAAAPIWRVYDDTGNVYQVDHLLTIGEPWTRKNWVVRSTRYGPNDLPLPDQPCSPIIIKDSFLEEGRLQASSEGTLLDHVHGVPPNRHRMRGVMTKVRDFIIKNEDGDTVSNVHIPQATRDGKPIVQRTKYRLILNGAAATSLYRCKTFMDFLMAMYDVLTVLRALHKKYDLLHQDVSPANILFYVDPEDVHDESDDIYDDDQPVFIRRLLAYDEDDAESKNQPTIVLIDFDNASLKGHDVGEWRTGTPCFIARQIASGKTADETRAPRPIPELEGEARAAYVHVFGEKAYDDNSRLNEGLVMDERLSVFPKVVPRPWHDAESCYWNIVHYSLLALPLGADPQNDDTTRMSNTFYLLDTHQIGLNDGRGSIVAEYRQDDWADILHKDLRSLAPFLRDLQDCMKPDWTLIRPDDTPYNVHEAMQRLIMREIWRLKETDPIALNTERHRVPQIPKMAGHSAARPIVGMKASADLAQLKGTSAKGKPGSSKKTTGKRTRQSGSGRKEASGSDEPKAKRARTKLSASTGTEAGSSTAPAEPRKSTRIKLKTDKK